jgi:cell division protein FtsZ
VPNDLLFGTLNASVELKEAVALSDKAVGQAAMALAVTLSTGGLLSADYDTLSALLNRKCTECAIARAVVAPDDPERERKLVENLLDSPLLRGSSELKKADAVLAVLNGGEKLSLGDANAVFENLRKYIAPDSELLIGAGAEPAWGSDMQLVVVTVRFVQQKGLPESGISSFPAKRSRKKSAPVTDEVQLELFEECGERGAMAGTDPVMVDGVDLDVPTFMRKNILVD